MMSGLSVFGFKFVGGKQYLRGYFLRDQLQVALIDIVGNSREVEFRISLDFVPCYHCDK